MLEEVSAGRTKNGNILENMTEVTPIESEPADRFHSTYILVLIASGIVYFPNIFFFTATDYWMYKFADRDATDGHRNYYQKSFLAICGTVQEVCAMSIIVAIFLGKMLSHNVRMKLCLLVVTILQLFVLSMVGVNTDAWREAFFYVSVACAGLFSIMLCATYITVIEMVSKFPVHYMGLVDTGWGMSAVISALVQIISLEIGPSSKTVAFIFFGIAEVYTVGGIIAYYFITGKSSYYKYVMKRSVQIEENPHVMNHSVPTEMKSEPVTLKKVLQITWKIKTALIAQVIDRSSSLAITPSITSLVESEYKGNGSQWNDVLFTPVIVYLLYNTFCVVTRLIVFSQKKLPCNQYFLFAFTILKLGLIPLIMLCNAQPRIYLPVIFNHDYYFIIFMIIMACADSFCHTSLVMIIPTMTPGDEYMANVISATSQTILISCCSYINILLVNAL